MFECQLVHRDMVKHLLAKWCLVIAVKQDHTDEGTCCPGEGEVKGVGHEDAHFVPFHNSVPNQDLTLYTGLNINRI